MRKILALVRAQWLTRMSYRVGMATSMAAILATVIPLYFIGNALQPVMAESIKSEGTQYFGFLIVGMVAQFFLASATGAVGEALSSGTSTGTLEALLSTPTRVPTLLAGLTGFNFVWAGVHALFVLLVGWGLGAHVAWTRVPAALLIVVLIILAHLPVGVIAGAMVLAFRTPGPLPQAAIILSGLLGGVYYPTSVIPTWIREVSVVLPLTYGLRALRRVILDGAPMRTVTADVGILAAIAVVAMAVSAALFAAALRYARRSGTLAQY